MAGAENRLRQIVEVLLATVTAIAQVRLFLGSASRLLAILRSTVGANDALRPAQFSELVVAFLLAHDIGDSEHFQIGSP